jgi:hypothetical protein
MAGCWVFVLGKIKPLLIPAKLERRCQPQLSSEEKLFSA